MRRGNLPDWVHDKATWKHRDRRNNVTPTCGGDVPQQRYLGVSFGIYRKRCRDVVMGRRGYVPPRRLGDAPMRGRWVFNLSLVWDVVKTYLWDDVATPF